MENRVPENKKKSQNRGFYIALIACLLALGGAVYIGMGGVLDQMESETLENTTSLEENTAVVPPTVEAPVEESAPVVNEVEEEIIETPVEEPVVAEVPQETAPVNTTPAEPPVFALPIEGEVLNPFSNGELVKSKTLNEWRTHNGVDIVAAPNSPVKAMADGVVEAVEEDPLWGICVTISHEAGFQSIYRGLKANPEVKVGDQVVIGGMIGYVGNTAEAEIAEDSHLHFEVKKDGSYIDPMSMVE